APYSPWRPLAPRRRSSSSCRNSASRRSMWWRRPGSRSPAPVGRQSKSRKGRRSELTMNPTQQLHEVGQSIWLDNITRALLTQGTLKRYIDELSVTGLTSNPTIFANAFRKTDDYCDAIREKLASGRSGDALFFGLALEDLTAAADLFRPINDATNGIDGWVSLDVSPQLAYTTPGTLAAAKELRARANRQSLFIKIPGTPEGLPAIEEAIFAGVPINV